MTKELCFAGRIDRLFEVPHVHGARVVAARQTARRKRRTTQRHSRGRPLWIQRPVARAAGRVPQLARPVMAGARDHTVAHGHVEDVVQREMPAELGAAKVTLAPHADPQLVEVLAKLLPRPAANRQTAQACTALAGHPRRAQRRQATELQDDLQGVLGQVCQQQHGVFEAVASIAGRTGVHVTLPSFACTCMQPVTAAPFITYVHVRGHRLARPPARPLHARRRLGLVRRLAPHPRARPRT